MRQGLSLSGFLVGLAIAGATLCGPASANPAMLFDLGSGKVLEHQDAFRRWHPASLTKLMTAYVTFRAVAAGELALDSPIKVSKHAAAEPPSKMGFKAGSVMTLDNALKMMLVKSANDIAMAVGENVGGSEQAFVVRMNAEAQRLGMSQSHFVNPNGLHSPDQYTTARDLALLVSAIRTEFPQYAPYFSIEGIKAGKKTLMSYNMLVGRYAGADGMKTGFVCASGFNMIGAATRGGKTLVAIVLGEKSAVDRTDIVAALLDRGFLDTGTQGSTVASLPAYGLRDAGPADIREEVCGKKKPANDAVGGRARSGNGRQVAVAGEDPQSRSSSPSLSAGRPGPIPLAMRDQGGEEYADVPIPTPRPDYPPVAKAAAQGDAGHQLGPPIGTVSHPRLGVDRLSRRGKDDAAQPTAQGSRARRHGGHHQRTGRRRDRPSAGRAVVRRGDPALRRLPVLHGARRACRHAGRPGRPPADRPHRQAQPRGHRDHRAWPIRRRCCNRSWRTRCWSRPTGSTAW